MLVAAHATAALLSAHGAHPNERRLSPIRCENPMADATGTKYTLYTLGYLGRRELEWVDRTARRAGMGPRLMDVVVEGKRYRTAAATLLANGPAWDERLGDEPRRLLEVRVGGVDLSAVAGGRGWEPLGWQALWYAQELRAGGGPTHQDC